MWTVSAPRSNPFYLTDIYSDEAVSHINWRVIWRGAEGDHKGRD